jgi:hypothetical protein
MISGAMMISVRPTNCSIIDSASDGLVSDRDVYFRGHTAY